jgi:acyl-CoA synthetase (AMP-forming)/AMP-acid ligase II
VNSHLTPGEVAYIVNDSGARLMVSSVALGEVAARIDAESAPLLTNRLMVDGMVEGWESYEEAISAEEALPRGDECEGDFLLYSSGTTGNPKGIRRPLQYLPMGQGFPGAVPQLQRMGFADSDIFLIFLCPAPLYHAAPTGYSIAVHRLGGTIVLMERFDAEQALRLIQRYQITHSQMVPTMFVRMLKLDDAIRQSYDVSSLQAVVHAAAPCPVDVKARMLDWWGPIIYEYYSATESIGVTWIDPGDWITHPGSVGRAIVGVPHIVDLDGTELPPGEVGTVWFSDGPPFEYAGDPEKTAAAYDARGWATVGDMGYLDDEGYVYLSDRRTFMIISGGVNIYPQEVENTLVMHPRVLDVAVFGIPDDEMGERVHAVVQPATAGDGGDDLAAELIAFCKSHLASYKCPKAVDFTDELPRLESGKLYKRLLLDQYREAGS